MIDGNKQLGGTTEVKLSDVVVMEELGSGS